MCGLMMVVAMGILSIEGDLWAAEVDLDGAGRLHRAAASGKASRAVSRNDQHSMNVPSYEIFSSVSLDSKAGGGALFNPETDIEVVWQKPRDASRVIFLAHGCSHGAVDFWPKSSACPKCIGLPEERTIVKAALRRGYMVVAISSMDRANSRCWSMPFPTDPEVDDDTTRVAKGP
jgi:hypothetical protein